MQDVDSHASLIGLRSARSHIVSITRDGALSAFFSFARFRTACAASWHWPGRFFWSGLTEDTISEYILRSRRNCFERHVINFVFPPHVSNALFETLLRKKRVSNRAFDAVDSVFENALAHVLGNRFVNVIYNTIQTY